MSRRRVSRRLPLPLAALLVLLLVTPALAAFPYSRNNNPTGYDDLYLNAGQVGNDLGGNEFKFAATPDPGNGPSINNNPIELFGVRGAHVVDDDPSVDTGFMNTTGRPDVTIAVVDSGIEWNNAGAMRDLRTKTRLNTGEVPVPRNNLLATPNEPGVNCLTGFNGNGLGGYDKNGDTVFNVIDYACDNRVLADSPGGVGPPGVLEPQDILIAFSDGTDADGNGYVDDMVGWDFLDDDNDPFDDVQYGHGTGEALNSVPEADNGPGGDLGTCPNCMGIHLRVGDSFVADVSRFGAAVTYATDNDVEVIQEALGTLNNSTIARESVNYAYRHGVTVMASAADEAAQHNNWPSTLPHTIVVNSIRDTPLPATPIPPGKSYIAFNGCTNFNAKITLSIPSTSCSSDAVGLAAGYAGLLYSAALNARDNGALSNYPDDEACERVNGDPCVITPNEVRQLLASGTVAGELLSDDIDFAGPPGAGEPEPSCAPIPLSDCTSPYGAAGLLRTQVNANRPAYAPAVAESYPARFGHDQFYGYGRANLEKATSALIDDPANPTNAVVPPEAEIFSPEWFEPLDPARTTIDVEGEVFARGDSYRCEVLVAPGQYPNHHETTDTPPGDFASLGSGYCDGTTVHSGAAAQTLHRGVLGTIDVADLKAQFPAATDFTGPIPSASPATGNGRPFFAPHAFTYKVTVTPTTGPNRTGEDQRTSYLHRDADLLPGYPKAFKPGGEIGSGAPTGDGESSPALADLDGDNRNELIFGSADGFVHAMRPDGTELPNWPVQGDLPGFIGEHAASDAYASNDVSIDFGGAFLGSVAVGDPDHDGIPTVYAADFEGKLYGWAPDGSRVFTEVTNPAYSGKPLSPFANVRKGETNRTQRGFFASPVLADLDDDGTDEIIAASMDRHVYAWRTNDQFPSGPGGANEAPGFPLLVVDPDKVFSVANQTHAITFKGDADSAQQGAIIDTPALADIAGDERPEIIIGTNEEYNEPINAGQATTASFGLLATAGILSPGNSRVYAIKPDGGSDGDPLPGDALLPGWPFSAGIALVGLLPVVGEGITGMPVVAELNCPSGGSGPKIGVVANNGPAYILNPDGTSCYGDDPTTSNPNALEAEFSAGALQVDHPVLPAVGHPAFGALGGVAPSFLTPAAGVIRASDLALPEYQPPGQDFVGAWDTTTGQFRPGFPPAVNDLQFLTGPAIADIDGFPGEEVVEGTASQDLAAFSAAGTPVPGWPKLSTDWTVAIPVIGSFGTLETDAATDQVVIGMTRSGLISAYATDAPACSSASWPRFHHDNANSGDFGRDAGLPGTITDLTLSTDRTTLTFKAPGDDLLCGTADHYEIATSESPVVGPGFEAMTQLTGAPAPADPGDEQTFTVPATTKRHIGIRAVDEQGNVGRVVSIEALAPGGGGGPIDPGDPTDPGPPGGGGACSADIDGTDSADRLTGTTASERIRGRSGNDRIAAGKGDDCVSAGEGNDRASGQGGNDTIKGEEGRDRIRGAGGNDILRGGDQPDRITGGGGGDVINAVGGGRDRIRCGGGRDKVRAGKTDRVARDCEKVKLR